MRPSLRIVAFVLGAGLNLLTAALVGAAALFRTAALVLVAAHFFPAALFVLPTALPAHAEPDSALVATRPVAAQPHQITLPVKIGLLLAGEHRLLAFEVPGRVETLAAEGQRIEAGGLVAKLGTALEQARLRQARLRLAEAKSELARIRGLRVEKATSAKELERAETALGVARAEREAMEEQLERRHIRAPFAGVVSETFIDPGEVVSPAAPVATLLDLSELRLEVGVPGYQVARVRPGARALVTIPALPAQPMEGVVARVAPAAAEGGHLFEVEIRIANPGERLRPGMSARAHIVTRSIERALVIPVDLLVRRQGRPVVFFNVDGRARAVEVGEDAMDGDRIVLNGDLPYRELVMRGQRDLRDGMALRVDNTILTGLEERP